MKDKKKRILLLFLVILLCIMGVSFAYYRMIVVGTKGHYITAATISLLLEEGENSIQLENTLPTKTTDGMSQDPMLFSIKNNGDYDVIYTIYLIDEELDEGIGRISDSYIDYYLVKEPGDNEEEQFGFLSDLNYKYLPVDGKELNGRVLDTGTITPEEVKSYSLRFWLDYSADNDAMGKSFSVKLYVTGEQVKEKVVVYDDGTGASQPDVLFGMIAVVYDEEQDSWVKADITNQNKSWYDYGEQRWANVVTVLAEGNYTRKYYQTAPVGTPILMSDINTMWVWIPRYSYTIKSEDGLNYYGVGSTDKKFPGEIDVKFIGTDVKEDGTAHYVDDTATNWYTHPAFTFGERELTGIWVAKFETGGGNGTDASFLQIKPNIKTFNVLSVAKKYQVARSMQDEKATFGFDKNANSFIDTHMMKNDEWSSVAFLSQSKYGKYGNSEYSGASKEVYINNSNGQYTGRSGGSYSGNTAVKSVYTDQTSSVQYCTNGFYTYNDYLIDYTTGEVTTTKIDNAGTGASTTGNIYGVYDMSGGQWEYVMGNYNSYSGYTARSYTKEEALAAGLNTGNAAVGNINSGFNGLVYGKGYNEETGLWDVPLYVTNGIEFPDSKYYNEYETDDPLTACHGGVCKGHSHETSGWYSDGYSFVTPSSPWVYRGGNSSNGAGAGVFSSLWFVLFFARSALLFPANSYEVA